ncbi:MAG: hypothetical protein WD382_03720 [Halofilum sp. (in: g-proteobacteria)]
MARKGGRDRGSQLGRAPAQTGSLASAALAGVRVRGGRASRLGLGASATDKLRAAPLTEQRPTRAEPERPPGVDLSHETAPLIDQLEARCERDYPGLLDRFPPTRLLEIYDRHADSPYWFVGPETGAFVDALERDYGDQAVLVYQQLLVAQSVARHSVPQGRLIIPRSLAPDIDRERTRMLADLRAGSPDWTSKLGDYFLKDLAVARFHMIPSGPHVAELSAGVPRRILITGGARQFIDVLTTFYLRRRPFRPMLHIHLSEKALSDFNPEGRERCFAQLAELLRANPNLAGVCAASWLYDPALPRVSPHLWFMQEPARSHDAKFFRLKTDEQSQRLATLKSATRRRLFEAGEYLPTAYAMIWFKNDLMRWAQDRTRHASEEATNQREHTHDTR